MKAEQAYYIPQRSERLYLRPLTLEDTPDWSVFLKSEIATKLFPADLLSKEDLPTYWINTQLKRYKDRRYGLMALIEQDSNNFIGMAGLLSQNINGVNELEVGYHLLPEYWGKGYASEASQHFKNYAFANHLAESIISIIHPENISSQKVAERNGMQQTTRAEFMGFEACIYRVTKEENERI